MDAIRFVIGQQKEKRNNASKYQHGNFSASSPWADPSLYPAHTPDTTNAKGGGNKGGGRGNKDKRGRSKTVDNKGKNQSKGAGNNQQGKGSNKRQNSRNLVGSAPGAGDTGTGKGKGGKSTSRGPGKGGGPPRIKPEAKSDQEREVMAKRDPNTNAPDCLWPYGMQPGCTMGENCAFSHKVQFSGRKSSPLCCSH